MSSVMPVPAGEALPPCSCSCASHLRGVGVDPTPRCSRGIASTLPTTQQRTEKLVPFRIKNVPEAANS